MYTLYKIYILLDDGVPILLSGEKALPIPGRLVGFRTEISAHYIIVIIDAVGAKIKWDGEVCNVIIFKTILKLFYVTGFNSNRSKRKFMEQNFWFMWENRWCTVQ